MKAFVNVAVRVYRTSNLPDREVALRREYTRGS